MLPTYDSVLPILEAGPWRHVVTLERWEDGRFVTESPPSSPSAPSAFGSAVKGIGMPRSDPTRGHVKRTPAHAKIWENGIGEQYLPGRDEEPRETSLVFDLVK